LDKEEGASDTEQPPNPPEPSRFTRAVDYVKSYREHRRTAYQKETPADRATRRTAVATIWIAAFTFVTIGVGISQFVIFWKQLGEMQSSGSQADKMIESTSKVAEGAAKNAEAASATVGLLQNQLKIMQGQLNEARFENRPWVGFETVKSDSIIESGKPFNILVFIKNFGRSPSPKVRACIGSDTPNINQRTKSEITKMMNQMSQCPEPDAAVLMPSGNFSFDVTRQADKMTATVAADVNREFATFAAFGRIDYEDADGAKYWTTFCTLYLKDGSKWNACTYGNEAH
jgi:hypothetical protein